MRQLFLTVASVAILLLNGCSSAILQQEALPSAAPPQTERATTFWWQPPSKPGLEMLDNKSYWEKQISYILYVYPDTYQWNRSNVPWIDLRGLLARDSILEQLPTAEDGYVALSQGDFQTFVQLYYGPEAVESAHMKDMRGYATDRMASDTLFIDPTTASQRTDFGSRHELVQVLPLDDDLERVEVEVNRYDILHSAKDGRAQTEETRVLSSVHRYRLRWGGAVGYLPEEISWQYVPTNRVKLEGNLQEFSSLWGVHLSEDLLEILRYQPQADLDDPVMHKLRELPSSDTTDPAAHPIAKHPLYVFEETVCQLRLQGNTVYYDSINLQTMEQKTGQRLYAFEDTPQACWQIGDNIVIWCGRNLYRFDRQMQLQQQIACPEAMPWPAQIILNPQLTQAAYCQDNRLYLLELTHGAQPRAIYTYIPSEEKVQGKQSMYPIRFAEKGRILVGINGWYANIKYLVLEPGGGVAAELPYYVSGEVSGGYSFSSPRGIAHYYDKTWRYFRFDTLQQTVMDGREEDVYSGWDMKSCRAADGRQHIWYFSHPQGDMFLPEKTDFYQFDFEKGSFSRLPFSVSGAKASLLAATKSGRILLGYAYKNECGFAVFTPDVP